MGIDAVALLRIPNLVVPLDSFGLSRFVEQRADAALLNTMIRFEGTAADQHALYLRQTLGDALDAHDDPRGVFFFPDVCEPRGQSYDAIVRELASVGVWAPLVTADHIPSQYTSARPGSHESLVLQLMHALGRDAASQLDLLARVHARLMSEAHSTAAADASDEFERAMTQTKAALGREFAAEYRASVQREAEREAAEEAARYAAPPMTFEPIDLSLVLGGSGSDTDFSEWLKRATAEVEAMPPEQRADLTRRFSFTHCDDAEGELSATERKEPR